jgi:ATP-dependent RNA helicase DeaD
MGFAVEMGQIMEFVPGERQTLLFSATVPLGIRGLIYHYLQDPEWVLLSEDQIYVKEVEHLYCLTPKLHKETTLYKLLEYENPASSMVFCNTKEETRLVYTFLGGKGMAVAMLSSDLPQRKREKVMAGFKAGEIRHLVTTDVASRGIDIEDLSHVFIFSTPDSPEQYIHRAGRTGRVGKSGRAISLVSAMDLMNFNRLVKRDRARRGRAEPAPRGLRGILADRPPRRRARAPRPDRGPSPPQELPGPAPGGRRRSPRARPPASPRGRRRRPPPAPPAVVIHPGK